MRIRTITHMFTILALAAAVAGCGPSQPVLHLYNWADYISPELVRQFERENHCRVVTDTFDSNEAMFAKLKAGATGYDLIFPSSYIVGIMRDQGMLQPLQHARLPNIRHLDPAYMGIVADPAFTYSVPYMISHAGLAYLKSRCPDFEPTWGVLDRESYRGRMTMLNDMRETIGAGLKFLGFSLNTTNAEEIAAARDVVIRWKRNLAKFENEQYKNGIASGEFLVVHGYNGDICQVMEENDDIAYAPPKEGVSLACDEMVIPRDAREVALAHAFINFLHDPAVAARNIAFVFYLCPNVAAYELLDEETRNDETIFLPAAVQARSEAIRDLGPHNALYIQAWDAIKAASAH
ncbi:MAG: spermidine/putrescine ABC transporter substrate-binding protein [Lentisphaerae bacterium]|nr:spermidine/putrescine ABC transporter substrate-binding protein [Lentisphaerota bacterium]